MYLSPAASTEVLYIHPRQQETKTKQKQNQNRPQERPTTYEYTHIYHSEWQPQRRSPTTSSSSSRSRARATISAKPSASSSTACSAVTVVCNLVCVDVILYIHSRLHLQFHSFLLCCLPSSIPCARSLVPYPSVLHCTVLYSAIILPYTMLSRYADVYPQGPTRTPSSPPCCTTSASSCPCPPPRTSAWP